VIGWSEGEFTRPTEIPQTRQPPLLPTFGIGFFLLNGEGAGFTEHCFMRNQAEPISARRKRMDANASDSCNYESRWIMIMLHRFSYHFADLIPARVQGFLINL
jgi:hypothetical protein